MSQPNVLIRDCASDGGSQPDLVCGTLCASPSIWVRHYNDGGTTDQSPIAGQTNYVYVRLENIGTAQLNNGLLHLYFAKGSTALNWPTNWVKDYRPSCSGNGSTVTYGDEIGTYSVQAFPAGASIIAVVPWNTVPNPNDFCNDQAHHFCVLARFDSDEDPIAADAQVSNIATDTKNSNNIAWRNYTWIYPPQPVGTLQVGNHQDAAVAESFRFNIDQTDDDSYLHHGRIQIDLGNLVFEQWAAGGRQGEGIEVVDETRHLIEITAPNARIDNVTMNPNQETEINVNFIFDQDANAGPFHWAIEQYEGDATEPVGGEQYVINLHGNDNDSDGKEGKRSTLNGILAGTFKLSAQPNPSPAATTLTYSLPVESTVSITIFDANGRPVRELLSNADRAAGEYQIMWDGASAGGKRVPSGTYICRLSTAAGSMEQQIKITR